MNSKRTIIFAVILFAVSMVLITFKEKKSLEETNNKHFYNIEKKVVEVHITVDNTDSCFSKIETIDYSSYLNF